MHIKKTVLLTLACLLLVTGVSWAKTMSQTSWTGYNNSYYSGLTATNGQLIDNESVYFTHSFPVSIGTISSYNDKTITVEGLGNWQANAGEPVLPFKTVKLVVPVGEELAGVKVITGNGTVLQGTYEIAPALEEVPIGSGLDVPDARENPAVYNHDGWYPEMPCGNFMVQKMKGYSVVFVTIHPYLYNPVKGQIKYYADFTVELKTVSKNNAFTMRSYSDSERELPVNYNAASEVADFVENPAYVAEYSSAAQEFLPVPRTAAAGLVTPGNFQYVIVTGDAIKNAAADYTVHDLITYKQSLGLTAKIVTIEEITAAYTGVDDAEKLRNFLKDAYATWQTEYVLLGGDTNIIPMRKLFAKDMHIPSDLYYQCLDGPYNADGDANWGEPHDGAPNAGGQNGEVDLIADIYVGRASAENAVEMSNFIYKTLKYQQENQNAPYLSRNLFMGEYMGSAAWIDKEATYNMENVRLGSNSSGLVTKGFEAASHWTHDTLYHEFEPEKLNKQHIINTINSNTYSLINHLGHGNTGSALKLSNGDEAKLTNTNPLMVYSQACYPGNFEADCLAERLTTSSRTGLFATIMNSRYGWSSSSQVFHRYFATAYVTQPARNIGKLHMKTKEFVSDRATTGEYIRWTYFAHTLFGDPHLELPDPDVDLTAPVLAGSLSVSNITSGGATLQWNAATDNKSIKAYEILEGEKTTLTGFTEIRKIVFNNFDNSLWVVDKINESTLTIVKIADNGVRTEYTGFNYYYDVQLEPDPRDGSVWAADNSRTPNLVKLMADGTRQDVGSFERIISMDYNKNTGSLWLHLYYYQAQKHAIGEYKADSTLTMHTIPGSVERISVNQFDNSTWYYDQTNLKVMRIDADGTQTEHAYYNNRMSAIAASQTGNSCWVFYFNVDSLVKYTPGVTRPEIISYYPYSTRLIALASEDSLWSQDTRISRLLHVTPDRDVKKYMLDSEFKLRDFAVSDNGSVKYAANATSILKMTGNMQYKVAETTGTSLNLGTLKPGTQYTLSVRALDNGGNYSAPTPAVTITTLPPAAPASPENLVSTAVTSSKITLDWADNSEGDLKGYFVYRRAPSESIFSKITAQPVLTSTYTDQNLINGTTYEYAVTAVNDSDMESIQSAAIPVTTKVNPAYPLWNASTAYTRGTRVTRNGNVYEAYSWSMNRDPELYHQSAWDEWNLIGPEE